jgi:hypothetical protein
MGEKKIRIKWLNIKARKLDNSHDFSNDEPWIISFSMFIENYWSERIPIKARIEIRNQNAGFKIMEENMVLDPQESNHFNIHEEVVNPVKWTTEMTFIYDVYVTIFNALGDQVDTYTTQMGFVGDEPFVKKQEALVYYHENEADALDDIMCMKQVNIRKIYYCAWEKKESFYQLCDIHGIKIIDVLPYVEISPQSIYQIEEYYGLYSNHPSVERWIVAPIMKKSDYYLVKEIASKNRIEIGEYPDTNTISWTRGFRQSREYEESGLPAIPESGWLFNSLNQSRPIMRVIKKQNQGFSFQINLDEMEVIIESHYLYKGTLDVLFGYEVLEDGVSILKKIQDPMDISPGEQEGILLKLDAIDYNTNCQYDLNVFATLAQDTEYEKAGYIIAMEQFRLRDSQKVMAIVSSDLPVRVQEKHRKLFLEGERVSCNISRQNGEILNLAIGSKEIFLKPMLIECLLGEDSKPGTLQFKGYSHGSASNGTEVVCTYKVKGYKGLVDVLYLMNGKNEIIVKIKASDTIPLKAVRLAIRMNDPGDAIRYFGKGPDDNTKQYNEGAYLGLFDIDAQKVDIERCDVQWMAIGEYGFDIDSATVCNCKIKKDSNHFVDIAIELIGAPAMLKIEV